MKNPFRKKQPKKPKLIINAIFYAERKWPNNLDYGHVMRTFVHIAKDQKKTSEEDLHDLLIKLADELQPCRL